MYTQCRLTHVRAVIYLRMSQDRTGQELGIERQRRDCETLIQQRNWTLAGAPFSDNDRSAAGRKPRPAFLALIEDINTGKVDVVVAWALDRLARTARDRLKLIEACQENKVIIALVRGSDIDCTTPAGRLTAGVLGEVAQHEIDAKSDRQKRAVEQAAEKGIWTGGRRPFGYDKDGVTVRLDEAGAIKEGYAALLSGASCHRIAQAWNEQGFRTGQAPTKNTSLGATSPWRGETVRWVLGNPRYAGIRTHLREERGPAQWPKIVDEETFRVAQAILRDRHRSSPGAADRQWGVLSGVALCGNPDCNQVVHLGSNSRGTRAYRCSSWTRNEHLPKAAGVHPFRVAAPCDEWVVAHVLWWLQQPEAWSRIYDMAPTDLTELRTEAGLLQRRLEQMAAEFAPELPLREYKAMTQATRDRLATVETKLASTTRNRALRQLIRAEDIESEWNALGLDQRRGVIDDLMTVTLLPVGAGARKFRPETVVITWNAPSG